MMSAPKYSKLAIVERDIFRRGWRTQEGRCTVFISDEALEQRRNNIAQIAVGYIIRKRKSWFKHYGPPRNLSMRNLARLELMGEYAPVAYKDIKIGAHIIYWVGSPNFENREGEIELEDTFCASPGAMESHKYNFPTGKYLVRCTSCDHHRVDTVHPDCIRAVTKPAES